MAYKKRTGGRKIGTPNKDRYNLHKMAEELKCKPFEILCHFANGDTKALGYKDTKEKDEKGKWKITKHEITKEMRLNAAREACQYLYPKKKAIEFLNDQDNPLSAVIFMPSNGRELDQDE